MHPFVLMLCRYAYLKECWALKPELRPTFANIVKQFSSFLESMASYVQLTDPVDECQGDKSGDAKESNFHIGNE